MEQKKFCSQSWGPVSDLTDLRILEETCVLNQSGFVANFHYLSVCNQPNYNILL